MNHWLIVPLLLPLGVGAVLLLFKQSIASQRLLNLAACTALLLLALGLLLWADSGEQPVYALGDWVAPFGIVLVLDRLSALMLLLTALVALGSLSYAVLHSSDTDGVYFHPVFQFQLLGLNGAFLTGDIFNLFVFFEILLIASYVLLLHGQGPRRARAGLHYVILNLVGSSLFLIAVGVLYGVLGTLNMADLARRMSLVDTSNAGLVGAAGLLLFVVFALKAALLPLYFWLPNAYSAAGGAVAALFAIMTKVGVYAIVRVYLLIFGAAAGEVSDLIGPWLLPLALLTLIAGALGALASQGLRRLLAYFVVVSVGTLLTGVGVFTPSALAASLLYLIHSTLVTAGLFLVADMIAVQRGSDELIPKPPVVQPLLLGVLFFLGAIAMAGLPPLSGFLGKVLILRAALENGSVFWVWSIVLLTSLFGVIAFARAGTQLFWQFEEVKPVAMPLSRNAALPAVFLLACSPAIMLLAEPIVTYTDATARQLTQPMYYIDSVLPAAVEEPIDE